MAKVGMFMNLQQTDRDMKGRENAFQQAVTARGTTFDPKHGAGVISNYDQVVRTLLTGNPDVLFATCWPSLEALVHALEHKAKIPIVYGGMIHPDGDKVIGQDGDPYFYGDHVTGILSFDPGDLCPLWVPLLTQLQPKVQRLAVLCDPAPFNTCAAEQFQEIKKSTSLPVTTIDVNSSQRQIDTAIAALKGDGGLVVPASTTAAINRDSIIASAAQHKVPAIYPNSTYTAGGNGGLMSYGPDLIAIYRRAAGFVDQIINGPIPASNVRRSIRLQENTTFELVINGAAAAALGISPVPNSLTVASGPAIPATIV